MSLSIALQNPPAATVALGRSAPSRRDRRFQGSPGLGIKAAPALQARLARPVFEFRPEAPVGISIAWTDRPADPVLRQLHGKAFEQAVMVIDSDPVRFCLLELHRAVILGQDPVRWQQWWHGDPGAWLDELIRGPGLPKAAAGFWMRHRRRLRRGLVALVLPPSTDAVQRMLLHTLLMPRRQAGRLLGFSDKVRRSGRFLDLCGRRRYRRMVSLWLGAAILRFTDPLRRARTWSDAMRRAQQWQGRLTSSLLACDPGEDERLRRWYAMPLNSTVPAIDRLSPGQIRANWSNATLLPRNTTVPAPSGLSLWQAMESD